MEQQQKKKCCDHDHNHDNKHKESDDNQTDQIEKNKQQSKVHKKKHSIECRIQKQRFLDEFYENPSCSINIGDKIACLIISISSYVMGLIFLIFISYFLDDSIPYQIRKYLPNINQNIFNLFDIIDVLGIKNWPVFAKVIIQQIFNILLLSVFWFQHIVMANHSLKKKIIQICPKFMIIDRATYNLFSSTLILIFFSQWQSSQITLLQLPKFFKTIFNLGKALGGLTLLKAVIDMKKADLLGIQFLIKVLKTSNIDFKSRYEPPEDNQIEITNMYRICRHPQQLGAILAFFFSGIVFTIDKVVFLIYMICLIKIGIEQEEKKLLKIFPQTYSQYQQTVPNQLFPNFREIMTKNPKQKNNLSPKKENQNQEKKKEQ